MAVPDWIKSEPSLWPQVRMRLEQPAVKKSEGLSRITFIRGWRLAMTFVLFAVLVVVGIWNQRSYVRRIAQEETVPDKTIPQITIRHAEVNGKKATPYVYQTTEVSFIWYSETKKSGG